MSQTWPAVLERLLGDGHDVVTFAHQAKHFSYFARLLDDGLLSAIDPDRVIVGFAYSRLTADRAYGATETSCQHAMSYRGFAALLGPGQQQEIRELIDLQAETFPLGLYETLPIARRSNLINAFMRWRQQRFRQTHPEYEAVSINGNVVNHLSQVDHCENPASAKNTLAHIEFLRTAFASRAVPVTYVFIPGRECYQGAGDKDASNRIPRFFDPSDDVIDLCEGFQQQYRIHGRPLHWTLDSHPNVEGYRLIGTLVHGELMRRGGVKPARLQTP